jgi:hypothetical protein
VGRARELLLAIELCRRPSSSQRTTAGRERGLTGSLVHRAGALVFSGCCDQSRSDAHRRLREVARVRGWELVALGL